MTADKLNKDHADFSIGFSVDMMENCNTGVNSITTFIFGLAVNRKKNYRYEAPWNLHLTIEAPHSIWKKHKCLGRDRWE